MSDCGRPTQSSMGPIGIGVSLALMSSNHGETVCPPLTEYKLVVHRLASNDGISKQSMHFAKLLQNKKIKKIIEQDVVFKWIVDVWFGSGRTHGCFMVAFAVYVT